MLNPESARGCFAYKLLFATLKQTSRFFALLPSTKSHVLEEPSVDLDRNIVSDTPASSPASSCLTAVHELSAVDFLTCFCRSLNRSMFRPRIFVKRSPGKGAATMRPRPGDRRQALQRTKRIDEEKMEQEHIHVQQSTPAEYSLSKAAVQLTPPTNRLAGWNLKGWSGLHFWCTAVLRHF